MNKQKGSTLTIFLTFVAIVSLVFANVAFTSNVVIAREEADFNIEKFGIKDGDPWLSVEGKAGGSTPHNASQIYAYVFVTDNGTYAVTSHGGEDSAEVKNDTAWHTHGVTLDEKKCLSDINDNGDAEVGDKVKDDDGDAEENDEVKVINISAKKVDKVMTAVLGIDNVNASICVEAVLDSAS